MIKIHSELTKLVTFLAKRDIPFEIVAWNLGDEACLQVCVPNKDECLVDAASHRFIYGGEDGLLEVMGSVNPDLPNPDVIGWLTAEEAFPYFLD